ncbi:MAG: type II secretion system protein GspN [Nitrospirae bacterium]|nr:type II secretion system protein GspN [Nitrospirota bacterium]
MSRHKTGLVAAIGYATAAVIAVTVFVYLTFPWQQLSDWIRVKIERAANVEITIEKSRVRFPFRLIWTGVTVRQPGPVAHILWTADQVSAGWPVGAILRRQLDLDLGLQGLGGEARGRVTARRTQQGMKYHLEAAGTGFALEKLAAGFRLPSKDIGGAVAVNRLQHDWMNGNVLQGQGLLALEAKEVVLKSLETRFARINGEVSLKGGMGHLENFSAQGDALDLVGSGSLLLRSDFMESLLNFTSRVTLRKPTGPLVLLSAMASPDGHLDIALRGPLKRPTPYVNGTPLSAIGVGGFDLPSARPPDGQGQAGGREP